MAMVVVVLLPPPPPPLQLKRKREIADEKGRVSASNGAKRENWGAKSPFAPGSSIDTTSGGCCYADAGE